jgi:general secretion pathway protein M
MNKQLSPQLQALRGQALARWGKFAPRERRLLSAAAAVLGFGIFWLIAVQPALRTLREAPTQLQLLDTQLQQMQRLAGETQLLRAAPQVSPGQAESALRGATDRLGNAAKLNLQGDRATVTLNGVPGDVLAAWLGEVRSAARARVLEAQMSRSGGTSGYSGTVTLALGRAG